MIKLYSYFSISFNIVQYSLRSIIFDAILSTYGCSQTRRHVYCVSSYILERTCVKNYGSRGSTIIDSWDCVGGWGFSIRVRQRNRKLGCQSRPAGVVLGLEFLGCLLYSGLNRLSGYGSGITRPGPARPIKSKSIPIIDPRVFFFTKPACKSGQDLSGIPVSGTHCHLLSTIQHSSPFLQYTPLAFVLSKYPLDNLNTICTKFCKVWLSKNFVQTIVFERFLAV